MPLARPHPGGQPGPHPRRREVRLPPWLQVLDLRHLVDQAGDRQSARRAGAHHPHPRSHERQDQQTDPRATPAACRTAGASRRRRRSPPRWTRRRPRCASSSRSASSPSPGDAYRRGRGRAARRLHRRRGRDPATGSSLRDHAEGGDRPACSATLTRRERTVIELRFGLKGEQPHTLEEIGQRFGLTRERIRQIEAKTLAKLQSYRDAQRLRDFLD